MSNSTTSVKKKFPGKLFVSSLALASFAERNLDTVVGLLLLDIALTFQVTVGAASQIAMISKLAAVAVGLLMGVVSVRFRRKSLLLAGLLMIIVGVLGCFFAPSFDFMRLFYPLDGVGTVIVISMSLALIGEHLPLEKRGRAIGWFVAGGCIASVIGGPLFSTITGIGGWRAVFGWFILPLSVASLLLVLLIVPSTPTSMEKKIDKEAYVQSFKQVLLNKSAAACLVGAMLTFSHRAWAIFGITFYRTRFSVPLDQAGLIMMAVVLFFALGNIIGGRLVNKYGRKRLMVLVTILASAVLVAMVYISILWIVFIFNLSKTLLWGIMLTSGQSLNLEQAPISRGTMMSIAMMFGYSGSALGTALGGTILDQLGFQALGLSLASMSVAAGLVIYFVAKDPCIRP